MSEKIKISEFINKVKVNKPVELLLIFFYAKYSSRILIVPPEIMLPVTHAP